MFGTREFIWMTRFEECEWKTDNKMTRKARVVFDKEKSRMKLVMTQKYFWHIQIWEIPLTRDLKIYLICFWSRRSILSSQGDAERKRTKKKGSQKGCQNYPLNLNKPVSGSFINAKFSKRKKNAKKKLDKKKERIIVILIYVTLLILIYALVYN